MAEEKAERVTIDKDIPLPPVNRRSSAKYPWSDMKIGDSFLFNQITKPGAMSQMNRAFKATGYRFTARSTEDGRVRCWRVA